MLYQISRYDCTYRLNATSNIYSANIILILPSRIHIPYMEWHRLASGMIRFTAQARDLRSYEWRNLTERSYLFFS